MPELKCLDGDGWADLSMFSANPDRWCSDTGASGQGRETRAQRGAASRTGHTPNRACLGARFAHLLVPSAKCRQVSLDLANERALVMGLILLIILILLLVGGLPTWPYARTWGYGPSGVVGLLLLILLVLLVLEVLPWGWYGPPVIVR